MLLRIIFAGALALAFNAAAHAQSGTGSSPLSIAKGGTAATSASGARSSLGLAIGSAVQAWDDDLDCIAAISSTGFITRTGAGACAARQVVAPAAGISVANPAGVGGNITLSLANDLAALESLSSTGIAVRTGPDAWNQRAITGTSNEVCATNGDGVSGNPTLGICSGFYATAHSWSGLQTFASPALTGSTDLQGALLLSGVISPSQITSNQNDYAPTGFSAASTLRLASDASRNITGIAGGAAGRTIIVHNVGSQSIVLTNQDTGSSAANRLLLAGDVTLAADTSITLRYDGASSRWRAITTPGAGGGGGGVTSVTVAAGEGVSVTGTCSITTSGTCTVARLDSVRQNEVLSWIYQSKVLGDIRRGVNVFATGFKGASNALNGISTGSSSSYTVDAANGKVSPTTNATTYVTGNRTATIAVAVDSSATIGGGYTPNKLVDGSFANSSAGSVGFSSYFVVDATHWIQFDFGSGNSIVVDEAKWYQDSSTTHGTWKWQRSGDCSSYTDIGSSFTLGGTTQTQTQLNGNTTGARCYRLIGVSGTASTAPFIQEIEFRQAAAPIGTSNMTLVTAAQTVDLAVTKFRAQVEFDNSASLTGGTDYKIEGTCNGGANWAFAGSYNIATSNGQAGRRVVETDDFTCPSGTSIQARLTTLTNKSMPTYGLGWEVR